MTMRFLTWIRRFGSVSAAIAILAGCAGQPVDVASTAADRRILVRPGRSGFVVAAHATGDASTAVIAREIAQHTGFGLVVAPGAASPRDAGHSPTEAYERAVGEAAQGPLRFFVEIRGSDRTPCAGQMDIATVGVDPELAVRLRALAELIRDAHLRANREIERLTVQVEGADGTDLGSGARPDDIRRRPERALQIELPRCARPDWREMYGAILGDFVSQAAALPAGR
jgi:hypothetical protein